MNFKLDKKNIAIMVIFILIIGISVFSLLDSDSKGEDNGHTYPNTQNEIYHKFKLPIGTEVYSNEKKIEVKKFEKINPYKNREGFQHKEEYKNFPKTHQVYGFYLPEDINFVTLKLDGMEYILERLNTNISGSDIEDDIVFESSESENKDKTILDNLKKYIEIWFKLNDYTNNYSTFISNDRYDTILKKRDNYIKDYYNPNDDYGYFYKTLEDLQKELIIEPKDFKITFYSRDYIKIDDVKIQPDKVSEYNSKGITFDFIYMFKKDGKWIIF